MSKDVQIDVKPLYTAVTDIRKSTPQTIDLGSRTDSPVAESSHVLDLRENDGPDDFYEFIPAYVPVDPSMRTRQLSGVENYSLANVLEDQLIVLSRQAKQLGAWLELPVAALAERSGLSKRTVIMLLSVLLGAITGILAILGLSNAKSIHTGKSGTGNGATAISTTQLPTAGGTAFRVLFPQAPAGLVDGLSGESTVRAPYASSAADQAALLRPASATDTRNSGTGVVPQTSSYTPLNGAQPTPSSPTYAPAAKPGSSLVPTLTQPVQNAAPAPVNQAIPQAAPVQQGLPVTVPTSGRSLGL